MGAAGLRLGMCFASPVIIEYMNKVKPPYNVGSLIQEKAFNLISENHKLADQINEIKAERKRLVHRLEGLSEVDKVFHSDANFLLVRFKNADRMREYLREQGIIVRDRSRLPGCAGCLRITVGRPEENDQLTQAIAKFV
jgi:histidinol-phosphate aminotransferase